jgi:hypothetical protein
LHCCADSAPESDQSHHAAQHVKTLRLAVNIRQILASDKLETRFFRKMARNISRHESSFSQ